MKAQSLFPVYVWHDNLLISESARTAAINYCKSLQQEDKEGVHMSNRGGWQSQSMHPELLIGTPLEIYFTHIKSHLDVIFKDLGSPLGNEIVNTWININNKDSFNVSHNHPSSTLSGCFYLTDENAGITFTRSGDATTAFLFGMFSDHTTEYSSTHNTYTPRANDIVIFPGWLDHYVEANTIDKDRISVAFNVRGVHKV